MDPALTPPNSPDTPTQPPSAPEGPEPPRLGILHLLVLTACVAVYMGLTRAVRPAFYRDVPARPAGAFEITAGSLYGIGSGAALAGLLLFVARRRRGLPFPIHPGEYLLVWMGFSVAFRLTVSYPISLMIIHTEGTVPTWWLYALFPLMALGLHGMVFIWVFVRVKIGRWRMFLAAVPASYVLAFLLHWGGLYAWIPRSAQLILNPQLLVAVVLMVVVLKDHLEGKRYPWTHWFGVATRLWMDLGVLAMSLWWLFSRSTPL